MKGLGPIHTYTTPWFDTRDLGERKLMETGAMGADGLYRVLERYCDACDTYVRAGAHECLVVPASQEGLGQLLPYSTDIRDASYWTPPPAITLAGRIKLNPPPQPGVEDVVPLAVEYIEETARRGERKYGTPLQTFNGRSALLDAMEEARDLFLYLFQACREQGLV